MATVGQQLLQPEVGWKRYSNTYQNISYSGSWESSKNNPTYDGTVTTTTQKGAHFKFSFKGTKLRILARRYPNGHSNKIDVYVDDSLYGSFSLVGTDVQYCLIYELTGLANGFHDVRIENNYTSGTWFHFYAVDIDETGDIREPYKKFLLSSEGKYYSINQTNPNTNAIPTMTSNTAPNGIASASSIYGTLYDAWKAFNGTVNDSADTWVSNIGQLTGWLKYQFTTSKRIYKYAITSRNDGTRGNIKDWTFEGSNDNSNWEVLDTRTNELNWGIKERREYVINFPKKFLYYRLNITGVTLISVNFITIGELEMFDDDSFITELTSRTVGSFIDFGMDSETAIDMYREIKVKNYIVQSSAQLSKGKVFKQKMDTTKTPIYGVSII